MITLTVATFNGAPLAAPLSAQFDELGGNIGRADNNQLVLPDPERTISRVHAQIVFRAGRYAIVDRGSNPISVNGRQLGNGQEAPLAGGEQVQIGGYVLRVELGGAGGAVADPFADFGGLAAPAAPRPAPAASLDPLAAFGVPETTPAVRPLSAIPTTAQSVPPAAPAAGGIPDDWDPFAPEAPAARPPDFARSLGTGGGGFGLDSGSAKAAPLIPDLPGQASPSSDSLDNLFGLGGGAASGGDPLAGGVFGQAAAQPNMAAHADPMQSLNSLTRASATARADASSMLNAPFQAAPPVSPAAPPPRAQPPVAMPPPAAPVRAPSSIQGAVLSWEDPSGESQTLIRPRARGAAPVPPVGASMEPLVPAAPPAAAPGGTPTFDDLLGGLGASTAIPDDALLDLGFGAPAAPVPAVPPAPPVAAAPIDPPTTITIKPKTQKPAAPVAPPPAAPAAAAPRAAPAGDSAALIAALREGLGMPQLPLDSLTPEFVRLLGTLVRESTRGTVELLVARAALKREIRAEVTMIVAKENNPLKFSPTVEVALGHLLSPPQRGFLPPDRAMREAYDDLRAHQFGFVAGMRAALEGVLKRFDPAVLEGKLTQKSVLASVLPAARKARMWDVFTELYGQISAEASDDFHELFGKEFLRAYEAHIDQLSKDR